MSRNFLDRRSTPGSNSSNSRVIQDLVVPEFSFVDFKLDSWGQEFEASINQKLFLAYESSNQKHDNFKKKFELDSKSLQLIKDKIIETEESKSSNYDFSDDSIGLKILQAEQFKRDQVEKDSITVEELDHTKVTLKIHIEEIKEAKSNAEILSEESVSSDKSFDDHVQYVPPRRPIDVDALILQKEKIMDELNKEKDILSSLIGEAEILNLDLGYYEKNSLALIQACKSMFKDSYELLNKLKSSGYANEYEIEGFKKLTAFFKMIVSNQPPQPDILGKAIGKICGDESKYFQMPELSSVLAKFQKPTSANSKLNNFGSSSNLKGSSSNLKGSSSNLKGSTSNLKNLRGSNTMGVGEWSSAIDINMQSVTNLLSLN